MDTTDLTGKAAVITGASSGIGEATARELDRAGMRLILTARRGEVLEQLAGELTAAVALPGDIADPDLPAELIEASVREFDSCDVVFNNAGVMHVGGIEDIDLDAVCHMVRVNVEAAYRMAYVTLRHFLKQHAGHLINTSSILGTKVRPTTGAYAGTKYAIEALSEALRMEVAGTGVRVGVVQPGLTQTHLQDHFATHPKEALGIRQMAKAEDLARSVRWLLEQPGHVNVPQVMVMPSEQGM